MSRRFFPHRFHRALQAGLPVQRRVSGSRTADAGVWVFTFDADGQCLSREVLAPAALPEPPGAVFRFTARGETKGVGGLLQKRKGLRNISAIIPAT